MKLGDHAALFMIGTYLGVAAACVYARIIFIVGRCVHLGPLQRHGLRILAEHKRHFPHSQLRKVLILLIASSAVCFLVGR